MPELPEVRQFLTYWQEVVSGQIIRDIVSWDAVVVTDAEEVLVEKFRGKVFTQFERVGKNMFTGTEDGHWLYFHFGMTGDFEMFQTGDLPPRFARFGVFFENGTAIAFLDARKFGRVSIIDSPSAFLAARSIGPDAMEVTWDQFRDIFAAKKGKIKAALLDQSLIAGVGNIYADEMLFQSGIHPEALLEKVGPRRMKKLYEAMRRAMAQSITYDTPAADIPQGFFITQRNSKGICPSCGSPIREGKVGGRTTYFCSKCQRK